MDLKSTDWYGQLTLTGVGDPQNYSGSIISILAELMKDLVTAQVREVKNGKEIVIRFRTQPFSSSKEPPSIFEIASLVSQGIEYNGENDPREGEDYQAYYDRLIESGYSTITAKWIASEWFSIPFEGPEHDSLAEWMNDPRAVRFRKLNASAEAFGLAHPTEYKTLKEYCQIQYPQWLAQMKLIN